MTSVVTTKSGPRVVKHKRRYCKIPGCSSIVKSQGLCQRHGAKPRMCKVDGCAKQAQGNFDGMCKSHFKSFKRETTPLPTKTPKAADLPPPAEGASVYDGILPASIAWQSSHGTVMPLIQHLKDGFDSNKPPAWHRNEERRARGLFPISNPATQLEGWERELVWMEILILSGVEGASFRHLARGWGRDKGFHMVLAQFICERRGNVERKKRAKGDFGPMEGSRKSARRRSSEDDDDEDEEHAIAADVWDDACYGDAEYNEALAADLVAFSSMPTDFADEGDSGKRFADNNMALIRDNSGMVSHSSEDVAWNNDDQSQGDGNQGVTGV